MWRGQLIHSFTDSHILINQTYYKIVNCPAKMTFETGMTSKQGALIPYGHLSPTHVMFIKWRQQISLKQLCIPTRVSVSCLNSMPYFYISSSMVDIEPSWPGCLGISWFHKRVRIARQHERSHRVYGQHDGATIGRQLHEENGLLRVRTDPGGFQQYQTRRIWGRICHYDYTGCGIVQWVHGDPWD